jgi:hypothetical protein
MPGPKNVVKMFVHIEIKGMSYPKGTRVKLFSEVGLNREFTDDAVEIIRKSVRLGTWQKLGDIEIKATRVRSKTGHKTI